jgi:hypothetical protein
MKINAQTKHAAAGIAVLGYMAMAYISGSNMAANRIMLLEEWVI